MAGEGQRQQDAGQQRARCRAAGQHRQRRGDVAEILLGRSSQLNQLNQLSLLETGYCSLAYQQKLQEVKSKSGKKLKLQD